MLHKPDTILLPFRPYRSPAVLDLETPAYMLTHTRRFPQITASASGGHLCRLTCGISPPSSIGVTPTVTMWAGAGHPVLPAARAIAGVVDPPPFGVGYLSVSQAQCQRARCPISGVDATGQFGTLAPTVIISS